mmetsp:Transcript_39189/g.124566  ORF Transcript_39189/g.124566 Transcript_39189/m.124566 type:complete len:406 (-) Transcript_39189:616-1833(-)
MAMGGKDVMQGATWDPVQENTAGSMLAPMALPAKAIWSRMSTAVELPSWAAYLPADFPGVPANRLKWAKAAGGSMHGSSHGVHNAVDGLRRPSTVDAECSVAGNRGADSSMGAGPDTAGVQAGLQPATELRTAEPAQASVASVVGRVWSLARDQHGCREVQRAIETAGSDNARAAIASELCGHVWEAMRCPHANHVLQKCIVAMRPTASQFIIDELLCSGTSGSSGASQAARHRYGCRIIERLVEHCPPSQVSELVEALVSDAVALSRHPYGNYVMQHLLEHGPAAERRRLLKFLEEHASTAGSDCYARAVISKALTHGGREDQVALARALLRQPGLLATMARTRHGHVAAKFVLLHLDGPDREEARRQLAQDLAVIRASRYGRFVAACLGAGGSIAAGGEPGAP